MRTHSENLIHLFPLETSKFIWISPSKEIFPVLVRRWVITSLCFDPLLSLLASAIGATQMHKTGSQEIMSCICKNFLNDLTCGKFETGVVLCRHPKIVYVFRVHYKLLLREFFIHVCRDVIHCSERNSKLLFFLHFSLEGALTFTNVSFPYKPRYYEFHMYIMYGKSSAK